MNPVQTFDNFVQAIIGNNIVAPDIYSADVVALNLFVTFVLAVIVAYTYKYVHKGISYSQSYVYSIVVVSLVVALAMMVIGNDITRAFALLGTFTIIRYRTAVKDPKDTAFIFLSLVLGLATGSSNYSIAISGTAIVCLVAIFLDKINFGSMKKLDYILYLTVDADKVRKNQIQKAVEKNFKNASLLNVSFDNNGDRLLYTFNVSLKNATDETSIPSLIRKTKGVENVELMTSENVIEF